MTIGEQEFNEWLRSIEFVDENNIPLPVVLTEDRSDDPEDDRGETK